MCKLMGVGLGLVLVLGTFGLTSQAVAQRYGGASTAQGDILRGQGATSPRGVVQPEHGAGGQHQRGHLEEIQPRGAAAISFLPGRPLSPHPLQEEVEARRTG